MTTKVIDYEVVYAPNTAMLGHKVKEKLEQGWQLQGAAKIACPEQGDIELIQTLVKVESDDSSKG